MEKSNFFDSLQAMVEDLRERIANLNAERGEIDDTTYEDWIRWTGQLSEMAFLAYNQFSLAQEENFDEEIAASLHDLEDCMRFIYEIKSDLYLIGDVEHEELENSPEGIGELLAESCKQFKEGIYSVSIEEVWNWIMAIRLKENFCIEKGNECYGEDWEMLVEWNWLCGLCNYLMFQLTQAFQHKSPVFLEAWEEKFQRKKTERKQKMN